MKIFKKEEKNSLHIRQDEYEYLAPNIDWFEESFYEYLVDKDIKEDYMNLIRNLDDESIQTISLIINRIREYHKTKNPYFLLTEKEKQSLNKIKTEFYPAIVKLNTNTWAYKDFLLTDNHFQETIFWDKYKIDELSNLDRDKNIIDVGAYCGDSAILFSRYTNNKVYAFEPIKEFYEEIKKNAELNNINNIIPKNIGLKDSDSVEQMYICGMASTQIKTAYTEDIFQDVEFTSLDSFVKKTNIEVGLIKVDVEGGELDFLKGAEETIKSQKPALIISIYHGAKEFFYTKPLIESWNLGYRFKIIRPMSIDISNETILIAEVF